jgi:hypothetical protein
MSKNAPVLRPVLLVEAAVAGGPAAVAAAAEVVPDCLRAVPVDVSMYIQTEGGGTSSMRKSDRLLAAAAFNCVLAPHPTPTTRARATHVHLYRAPAIGYAPHESHPTPCHT